MILELIKIYFTECDLIKDRFIGTAHIRFKEFHIDLKGVYFRKKKDFFVAIPTFGYTKEGYDKVLRTPIMSFGDENTQKEFYFQLKEVIYKGIVDHKIFLTKNSEAQKVQV